MATFGLDKSLQSKTGMLLFDPFVNNSVLNVTLM